MLSAQLRNPKCQLNRLSKRFHSRSLGHVPSKNLCLSRSRPVCLLERKPGYQKHTHWAERTFSSTSYRRNEAEELVKEAEEPPPTSFSTKPRGLTDEAAWALLQRASEAWPTISTSAESDRDLIMKGWSSNWNEWEYLFPLYWHSSKYLMIPGIEMFVNLQYGLEGETRPLLFSIPGVIEGDFMFFHILGKEDQGIYLANLNTQDIYQVREGSKLTTVDSLVATISSSNPDALHLDLLPPSEEGCKLLTRILERDPTVREDLGSERWLGMVPAATEPWQEWAALPESEEDAENDTMLKDVTEFMEKRDLDEENEEVLDREGEELLRLVEKEARESVELQLEGEEKENALKELDGITASEWIQDLDAMSEEERAAVEQARESGLTRDLDEAGDLMDEAEGELERTLDRMADMLRTDPGAESSESSSAGTTEATQPSIFDDSLASDPDAVDHAIEQILNSNSDDLSISHLRKLSIEQLAEVEYQMKLLVGELDEQKFEQTPTWESEEGKGIEVSRGRDQEDERIGVRVPYRETGETGVEEGSKS